MDTLGPGASRTITERRALGIGVLDQSTWAASALALQLGLARFLPPEAYGSFTVSFSLLVFFLGVHATLIAEPMAVLGPRVPRQSLFGYIRTAARLSAFSSLTLAVISLLCALVLRILAPLEAPAFAAMSLAVIPYLLLALTRRAAYLASRPVMALWSSLLFAVGLAIGGSVLVLSDRLTASNAYLLLTAASLVGSLPFLVTLATAPRPLMRDASWREVAGQNWEYGKWVLAAGMAHWMGSGVLFPVVAFLVGLTETGAFRALSNLVAPVYQGLTVATLVFLPQLAGDGAQASPRQALMRVFRLTVPASMAYGLMLVVWGQAIIAVVYNQPAYDLGARYLFAFALHGVLLTVAHMLSLSIRGLQDTRTIFWSKVGGALSVWLIGLPLIRQMGLWGAVLTLVLATAVETAVLAVRFPWRAQHGS
jgi:O-antigen/teichoic acid export membrane protein